MAIIASSSDKKKFMNWLSEKLSDLNTDEKIFGSYILGILEEDENREEKMDALEGILSEIIEDKNLPHLINEILNKWSECQQKSNDLKSEEAHVDFDEQLARMLEKQKLQINNVQRKHTEEEQRIREKILSQYSQTEISEDEDDSDDHHDGGGHQSSGIVRNTNASEVMQMQKERREQLKMECQRKKEKDKEDREKQKALREEKKEKRKTVKGERRR